MLSGYANANQPTAPTQATLNERLNKVAEGLAFHCERIESVLARVNGTPPTTNVKEVRGGSVSQISPTHSLANIVDMLEHANGRISDLATGVERIA